MQHKYLQLAAVLDCPRQPDVLFFMKTVLSVHGEWLCSVVSCCACLHLTVDDPCLTKDALVTLVMSLRGGEEIFSIFLFSPRREEGITLPL